MFHHLYQQQAKLTHGYLDRNPGVWERLIQPEEKEAVYGYLIGNPDQPQGYIIFSQHLQANNDKFILSVANGNAEVKQGGKGELQLDITGLASLYTGLFTPHNLKLAGKLDATDTALLAATQIFASPSPWMADFF
ncbi:sterol carrier protein domain-containing protein [Fortiea sp. LEGE XX443]|uniref:sterol carrier protein domain-containing protein n=1 Tax=Fortiea sp. LEGE XX443 TaxID=1828611 RepID=UPI00351CB188